MVWFLLLALAPGAETPPPAPVSSGQIETILILPRTDREPAVEVAPVPGPDSEVVPAPTPAAPPEPIPAPPVVPTPVPSQLVGDPADDRPLLTLDEALRLAQKDNLDLRIGREMLDRAAILSSKAWSVLLPTVSVNLGATYFDKEIVLDIPGILPEPISIQRQDRVDLSGSFEWTLLNGRSFPLLMNAYASVDVAHLRYSQAERTLQTTTTLAYFRALGAQRQVEVRRRALGAAREHLRLAALRVEVGDAYEVEAVRSETVVATEEQALLQTQNSARQARLALAALIGTVELDTGDSPEYRFERPPAFAEAAPETDTDADTEARQQASTIERAIAQRLDLKQRRVELGMANRSRGEVWTRFLPALVASGVYAWSNDQGFSGDNVNWNLSLALRWTVISGGLDYWTLQESRYDLNAAALRLEKTRQEIAREVREAELNLASALAGLRLAGKRVALAKRSAAMIRAQYEVGQTTQLDLIDANRALADAETAATLAQLQVDVGRVTREQAVYAPARVPGT